MAHALVLYGTTEGQTAKIAQHIADRGRAKGHTVDLIHGAELPEDFALDRYAGVLLGASLHEGHHQRYVRTFVTEHRDALERTKTAFFSVSLSAASAEPESREAARTCMEEFFRETKFRPQRAEIVAGALRYTQYSWWKRALLKQISKHQGGDTDTSRDHEYTDWNAVDRFADAFFDSL